MPVGDALRGFGNRQGRVAYRLHKRLGLFESPPILAESPISFAGGTDVEFEIDRGEGGRSYRRLAAAAVSEVDQKSAERVPERPGTQFLGGRCRRGGTGASRANMLDPRFQRSE